ncbi:uncharacterized protein LOC109594130 isoform X2 [Aethina tumida]|nr:uncharacterized protein LOC109594130 isoform X2 [Aethina tumida]
MERFDIKSSDIHTLLQNCLEENNYKNFNVNITGTTGVGEGYTGLVIFAEASGIHNGEKITLKFVIKHSTTKKEYRKEVPINTLYKLEALVYESLFPKYQQLINQTGATALNLPKWYKSVFGEDSEIMIFEDLKQKGYEMHDRKVRFNLDHIKVVLEKYAKLHALSFAMRDQRPKEFNEIVTTIDGLNRGKKSATIGFFQEFSKILPQTLELNNENELLNRVKQIEICDLYDIIDNSDNQSVILHIDCWNNNFLFKYPARQSKAKPDGVIIIDWQLASVGSPISD